MFFGIGLFFDLISLNRQTKATKQISRIQPHHALFMVGLDLAGHSQPPPEPGSGSGGGGGGGLPVFPSPPSPA
ncbi:MAG: hypothetical protein KAH17_01520 [Bacteroidales bacterium]|nr:hypothetical protein [Bacteroidales bacterium]